MNTLKILKTLDARVGLFNFAVILSVITALTESIGLTSLVTILIYGDFFVVKEIEQLLPSFFLSNYFQDISKEINLKTIFILFSSIIIIRQVLVFISNSIIVYSQTFIEANLRKKILRSSLKCKIDELKKKNREILSILSSMNLQMLHL